MRYLSLLALLSSALVSTVEASSSQRQNHYLRDDQSTPAPRMPLMQLSDEQLRANHAQAQLNAAYHLQFQTNSNIPMYAPPMGSPQFYEANMPSFLRPPFITVPTPQSSQPMSIYAQLRYEQEQACNAAAQRKQNKEDPLVTDRKEQEKLQRFPSSTAPRSAHAQFLEQPQHTQHKKTAHPYYPSTQKPSQTFDHPLRIEENVNNSNTLHTRAPSAPAPKPIELPTVHHTPQTHPFVLTQHELLELSPIISSAKILASMRTETPHKTQTSPAVSITSKEGQERDSSRTAIGKSTQIQSQENVQIPTVPTPTTASLILPTKPPEYEQVLFISSPDPRLNNAIIVDALRIIFQKHFNSASKHLANPLYHSLKLEKDRLQAIKDKSILDHMKLSKLERGIPMIEHFESPENFEFSAGVLINSLYDPRVLPSRRFAIHTLLTSPTHYGPMLDLHHRIQIERFEDEAQRNTIFRLPRFFKETPLKALTEVEKRTHPSVLRNRPYNMATFMEKDAETRSLADFSLSLNFKEIMGEETSEYHRALTFNAIMHEKAAPLIRALALHLKASRILTELQAGRWVVDGYFNAETARQCLELAYHSLESLSFREINDTSIRQQKLAFKQALLHEINEDANALRFLFTYD